MRLRLFSVDDANRLIPALETLLSALAARKAELLAKQAELSGLIEGAGRSVDSRLARLLRGKEELKFIAEEFNVSLHEVSRLGCLLKDVDAGLVDFPAVRDGREVFLCWKRGEPRVAHWHGIDEGFAGRKPLEEAEAAAGWTDETGGPLRHGDADADSPTFH